MAEYSVFGTGALPWTITGHDDGSPIVTASAFYATTTPWYVVGARLYVPAGAPIPAQATIELRTATYETPIDLSTPAVASQVIDLVAGGWNEARWPGVPLSPTTVAWISCNAGNYYSFGTPPTADPFPSVDGVDIFFAEDGDLQDRGAYLSGGVTNMVATHYGLGILVSDTPGGPASGGSIAEIRVSVAGGGFSTRVGSSASGLSVTAGGQGFKVAQGGSKASLSVVAGGSGLRISAGGSRAGIDIAGLGVGLKIARAGSATGIWVFAEGAGHRVGTRQGGSQAGISVTARGNGYNPDQTEDLPEDGKLVRLPRLTRQLINTSPRRRLENL